MTKTSLYRQYRPIDFDTVVGQDSIITTLKNQILKDRISHAYLFCGTRGTGKTTVAKIFARAVNCENKKENDANPCNECEICKSIIENKDINVYEIDAASNNGIEDIRNIIDLTEYPPTNGEKYKVFIIDEAHELSDKAKDAFLKTLEEPPSYVIFILCTTEPYQFKQTILSRCQRYDFKRININDIVKYLKYIAEKEKINITDDALYFIAERSDGSMRESISLLDRVKSYEEENIDLKIAEDILGVSDEKQFKELTISLINDEAENCIIIINKLINEGKEITQFVNDYIWYLRNVLLVKNMNEPNEVLTITKEKFDELKEVSNSLGDNNILWYIDMLQETSNLMKQEENKRVQLETCFIRMCMPESDISKEGLINRIELLENKLNNINYKKVVIEDNNELTKEKKTINDNKQQEKNNENKQVKSEEIKKTEIETKQIEVNENLSIEKKIIIIKEHWNEIISNINTNVPFIKTVKIEQIDDDNCIKLISNNGMFYGMFSKKLDLFKESTKKITGIDINFIIENNIKKNEEENAKLNKIIDNRLNNTGVKIETEE